MPENTKSTLGVKVVILCIAFAVGCLSIALAAVETISTMYPDVPEGVVLMVGTLPTLVAFPVMLASAWVYKLLGYKMTGIVALVFIALGALPMVVPGFTAILASRVLVGVGYGIVSVLPATMVGLFLSGKEQTRFYGYQVAMLGIAGVVFGFLGGIATSIDVNLMWGLHLLFLVFVPVVMLCMKEPTADELAAMEAASVESAGAAEAGTVSVAIPGVFFVIIILHFLAGAMDMTFYANPSYLAAEYGIPNSATFAGTMVSAFSIGALLGGMIVGRVSHFTKAYTICASLGCSVVACLMAYLSPATMNLLAASFILGIGDSMILSSAFMNAGFLVPGEKNGLAVGLINGLTQAGCFFGPYIPIFVVTAMGAFSYRNQMLVAACIGIITIVVYAIIIRGKSCEPLRKGFAENA